MSYITSTALAADTLVQMNITGALESAKVQMAIYDDIALYWGPQKHPRVIKDFGEFKTSKRTNKFVKDREKACQWALATAIKVLQERARKEGGNAVIRIKSNVKFKDVAIADSYECLCGTMRVNVALKGTVVNLEKWLMQPTQKAVRLISSVEQKRKLCRF